MKWSPQPKEPCKRPDCDKPMRNWGYCTNHANLWRRNGTPYRRDEIDEIQAGNKYEREMDEALAADPVVIGWVLHPRRRVMVHISIYDPHQDHPNPRREAS